MFRILIYSSASFQRADKSLDILVGNQLAISRELLNFLLFVNLIISTHPTVTIKKIGNIRPLIIRGLE